MNFGMSMEPIKQLDLHCPKCSEKMVADVDLEGLVKDRAQKLLDLASEIQTDPRTITGVDGFEWPK